MRYAYNSGYYHDVYSAMMSAMVVIYMVIALVNLVVYVLSIIADYRLFEKAGEEGWKAIIPFYNYFVLCRIVMGDSLWFWLGFVPGINVFGRLYIRFKTGEAYGKTTGFNIGMMLLPYIFRVILAFDAKTVYYGPDNMRRTNGYNQQNPYGQGNSYAQNNPYAQNKPYAQNNPYVQADTQQNPYAPVYDSLNSRDNGNL